MSERTLFTSVIVICIAGIGGAACFFLRKSSPSVPTPPPAKIAVSPPSGASSRPLAKPDQVQEELARLRAENDRLRHAAQATNTQAPGAASIAPSAASALPATVSGAIWMTKNDGGSDVMRGISVAIVQRTIDSSGVADELEQNAPDWIKLANDYHRLAKDSRDSAVRYGKSLGKESFDADLARAKEDEATATQYEQTAARFKAWRQTAPAQIDLLDAHAVLRHSATGTFPPMLPGLRSVSSTQSNVDGKYSVSAPPGRYYAFATFASTSLRVDWIIPVDLHSGEKIPLDLFNDNAAIVKNGR